MGGLQSEMVTQTDSGVTTKSRVMVREYLE